MADRQTEKSKTNKEFSEQTSKMFHNFLNPDKYLLIKQLTKQIHILEKRVKLWDAIMEH